MAASPFHLWQWLGSVSLAVATLYVPARGEATEMISVRALSQVSDLQPAPPDPGSFRVRLIDAATGLAVLVEGHDFNLLVDGGLGDEASFTAPRLSSGAVGVGEKALLELHVDTLEVGLPGALTSHRREFIEAVVPRWALVNSWPFKYDRRTLPDPEVIKDLMDVSATVFRTWYRRRERLGRSTPSTLAGSKGLPSAGTSPSHAWPRYRSSSRGRRRAR
jgi:beta-lactamase superfamily II metal-dependent hydrolase